MNKLTILGAVAILAGGLATTAMADDFFDRVDGNNDSIISMAEAHGAYSTLSINIFNLADADGDGSLDESEFYLLGGLSAGLD
jgi:hypothetical protein